MAKAIPLRAGLDPLQMLTSDSQVHRASCLVSDNVLGDTMFGEAGCSSISWKYRAHVDSNLHPARNDLSILVLVSVPEGSDLRGFLALGSGWQRNSFRREARDGSEQLVSKGDPDYVLFRKWRT